MNNKMVKHVLKRVIQVELVIVVALAGFALGRKSGIESTRTDILAAMQSAGVEVVYREELKTEGQIEANQNTEVQNMEVQNTEGGEAGDKLIVEDMDESQASGTFTEIMESSDSNIETEPELTDAQKLALLWEEYPHLLLVNKDNILPEDYSVELKRLPDRSNNAAAFVYDALTGMLEDGRKQGLQFEVCSSYRSVERQRELLEEDIEALQRKGYTYEEAYAEATRETMPPGYSEHATGMAFDIVALNYQMLDKHQKKTPENIWLREHCHEYGFILRYPQEKEEITGISYESWHFRYVGKKAAAYIMEQKITLEEFLEEYLAGTLDIDNYKES